MSLGDVSSIAFVVIIITSLFWPFIRDRGRRRLNTASGGPKDFAHSGGYTRSPLRNENAAPLASAFTGFRNEDGEALPHHRVEERLTRDELAARGSSVDRDAPTGEQVVRRSKNMRREDTQRRPRAESIHNKLSSQSSAQEAYVIMEVLDRPVGMRN